MFSTVSFSLTLSPEVSTPPAGLSTSRRNRCGEARESGVLCWSSRMPCRVESPTRLSSISIPEATLSAPCSFIRALKYSTSGLSVHSRALFTEPDSVIASVSPLIVMTIGGRDWPMIDCCFVISAKQENRGESGCYCPLQLRSEPNNGQEWKRFCSPRCDTNSQDLHVKHKHRSDSVRSLESVRIDVH